MKKNKKVVIICAIIVAIIVISLIFALVYKGKTGKLPFEKTEDEINTVKMVENSTIKVTLGEVATTDDYMIIEYEVDIKDKNIEIENGYLDYVSFEIDRDIKIDGKEVNYTDEKGQFAYKESDNKVKVYDLINIKNKKLSDTYKLEVTVYDIYGDGDEIDADLELEDTNGENADEEIYDEEDTEEYVDETEADGLEEDSAEGGYEEVTIDSDEYYQAIENKDEETLIEESTSEEDSAEDTTDEISSEDDIISESDKIGTITVKLNKTDTNKNASIIKKNEKSTQDNVTVNVNTIIKTNSAKFITVETEVTGVTKEQIENDDLTNPENIQIAVLDKDGNTLNVGKVEESYLYDSEGNEIEILEEDTTLENGKAKITTIIALAGDNKDLDGLKVQAYFEKYDEDQSNNDGHSIEDQKYSAENSVGEEIEI